MLLMCSFVRQLVPGKPYTVLEPMKQPLAGLELRGLPVSGILDDVTKQVLIRG
jgi:hypothetical protein